MQHIHNAWFIKDIVKVTEDMWLKGWNERNGGNISLRLTQKDICSYENDFYRHPRFLETTRPFKELANQYFLVTGSGKFFRNVMLDPEDTLALIQINEEGTGYHILWGLHNEGVPTSELTAHLQSHITKMQVTNGQNRVIMHGHATHLIALSYVLELNYASFTKQLWEMSTECLVVFPEGIGIVPWMVPGTDAIGDETALLMKKHNLVLWPFHGIFGAGATLDEAFGLIDTAEKAAQILVNVMSMGGKKQTISTNQLIELAKRFNVTPLAEALAS
ncbi:Rhamnulose-1-phosphate aldolase [Commensalibacter sp. Nvir]|uniref:rhamnulose-1-phosphate aldolase n=1 Tax=Commensalibacter sp. Nvir TaxID=3069817 RepID=UPI002D6E656B|nr:Rhamnulose-1-phosphate aldolase [Commensalibacter sp. Nvir]